MTKTSSTNFPQLVEQKVETHWNMFSDRYPEYAEQLVNDVLIDFKKAIGLSDFVLNSALQAPELVVPLFVENEVYAKDTPDYFTELTVLLGDCQDENNLSRTLRRFRLKQMVKIAVADMVLDIELDSSLARLSELADALISCAHNWLSNFCKTKWGVPTSRNGEEQELLIFGMGKLGGKELNFSSDIDLIFSYPDSGETIGARRSLDNQQYFIRLAQKLITALNQQTADGFVFRVDMRLRPFGESGPLVMNFNALEDYYQDQGREWERYAMLKARLIGNGKFHDRLTQLLRPFVYRRYIDFSVIDSLRRMKMMIAQEVRRKHLTNNIKLGAGGIREVEFIVQVFQMIRGGREPELQQRNLLTVLPLLVKHNELTNESKQVLENSYRFLRRVENIMQAIGDQQTQTLPESELDKQRLLAVLSIDSWQDFTDILSEHMDAVHQVFKQIIGEESPNHSAQDQHWQTLWMSQWNDEECSDWIEQECAEWNGEEIWKHIKAFRQDTLKRSIGSRGQQVLDKLLPLLIWHLHAQKVEPIVFERIFKVLSKILTRTAYLELLYENEGALNHLVKLCRASSWIAEHIAKFPILLDELIDPKLLNNPPALSSYSVELRETMLRVPEEDLEAQMDALRQFKQAQQLRIAAGDVSGVLPLTKVSDHLTALAEAIIGEVVNVAWQQVALRFGVPASTENSGDKGFAVIGYGKMGGIELGYGSDLDLVFLHASDENDFTTGNKQVSAGQFYSKLAQRIMHLFNTRMASGILYELDLRLRPSGNSGVLVVHRNTYKKYLEEEAWTWEHQALVRARFVYGSQKFYDAFSEIRKGILCQQRDKQELAIDVKKMRAKMQDHLDKSNDQYSDIKQGNGGLVDIEFLAQYLVLNNAYQHPSAVTFSDNYRIFEQLAKLQILTESEKDTLIDSYCQLRDRSHMATLQSEKVQLEKTEFDDITKGVTSIYQRFLN